MTITEFKKQLPNRVSIHSILFSTPMVQAIMDGRKTQTRRTVKTPRHKLAAGFKINSTMYGSHKWPEAIDENERGLEGNGCNMECPYGKPGDILWVRETWQELVLSYPNPQKYVYSANVCSPGVDKPSTGWRPSIHMPFEACRIFLKVKSVRVERLQDISEDDAQAEGVDNWTWKDMATPQNWMDYMNPKGQPHFSAYDSFVSLWDSINGPDSWDENPWVWVIEFERVNKQDIVK